MIDAKTFGAELAAIVQSATLPLIEASKALQARVAELEKALSERPEPENGKDADPEAVAAIVFDQIKSQLDEIQGLFDTIPEVPQLPDIPALIADAVADAIKAIPEPENGKDGAEGPKGDVGEKGRDGLDLKDLFRADGGRLVAVMSDGTTKDLGEFVGKDGAPGRDGKDGLGFDDLEFTHDDFGRPVAKFQRGDVVKSVALPCIIDRGPYKPSDEYRKGDAVSYGGSLWVAQKDAPEGKPGDGSDFRLAVKKGRDGRDTEAKKVI